MAAGQLVQLDGSGSRDANGEPLSFRWTLTTRPAGSQATLSNTTLVNPTFVADVLGTYVAQLIVNDGRFDSDPDTVTLIIPVFMVECISGAQGGDRIDRGFYIPNYPDNSLARVELFLSADTLGDYTFSLELHTNTYDGVLLGTDTAAVTLSGSISANQLTIFEFPGVTVSAGTTVTFALQQVSGPTSNVFYAVPASDPSCPVVQTEDTSPPLSTFRRNGVEIRIIP